MEANQIKVQWLENPTSMPSPGAVGTFTTPLLTCHIIGSQHQQSFGRPISKSIGQSNVGLSMDRPMEQDNLRT